MADYRLVQTDRELGRLLERLRQDNPQAVAVDLESEHNLHSYGIHVALVQVFDGGQAHLIDTLAVKDRGLLRSLLEESPWVKVMFDASGDLATLGTAMQMSIRPVFDLSIAARLLGRPGSLNKLLDPESSGGKSKFQKANWLKRPLPPEQLEYAAGDVLPCWSWPTACWPRWWSGGCCIASCPPTPGCRRRPGPAIPTRATAACRSPALFRGQKRALALLWRAREKYAERHDLPPHNVAAHEVLAGIARAAPTDPGMAEALGARRSRVRIDVEELTRLIRGAGEALETGEAAGSEEAAE